MTRLRPLLPYALASVLVFVSSVVALAVSLPRDGATAGGIPTAAPRRDVELAPTARVAYWREAPSGEWQLWVGDLGGRLRRRGHAPGGRRAPRHAQGLTLLDAADATDQNGIVVTKETAAKYNLKKISDLAPVAKDLVFGGPPECPNRQFCAVGLKNVYGITFKDFKPLDAGGPLTVAALDGKQIDVALLFTSDPTITARTFVLLEDDKKLQLADNIAPVVRTDLLSKDNGDIKKHLNAISAKLSQAELGELNKAVSIDKKDSKDVAAAWLKKQGLIK